MSNDHRKQNINPQDAWKFLRKPLFHLVDGLQLRQEPSIDVGHLPDLLNGIALVECGGESEDALVRGIGQFLIDVLHQIVLDKLFNVCIVGVRGNTNLSKPEELVINSANSLLDSLLECPANTHHFANALHATAQQTTDSAELLQVPTRNLYNHVVQAGFEASTGDLCDGVLDLVEWNTKTEFGRNESEGIACCFGCEG